MKILFLKGEEVSSCLNKEGKATIQSREIALPRSSLPIQSFVESSLCKSSWVDWSVSAGKNTVR